jgi:hypothetical protein
MDALDTFTAAMVVLVVFLALRNAFQDNSKDQSSKEKK